MPEGNRDDHASLDFAVGGGVLTTSRAASASIRRTTSGARLETHYRSLEKSLGDLLCYQERLTESQQPPSDSTDSSDCRCAGRAFRNGAATLPRGARAVQAPEGQPPDLSRGRVGRSEGLLEPEFYATSAPRLWAEWTYRQGLHCVCASPWLAEVLTDRYGASATAFASASTTTATGRYPPTAATTSCSSTPGR